MKARITIKKYMGDCPNSWAVFVDGRVRLTGLSRREAIYYQALERKERGFQ